MLLFDVFVIYLILLDRLVLHTNNFLLIVVVCRNTFCLNCSSCKEFTRKMLSNQTKTSQSRMNWLAGGMAVDLQHWHADIRLCVCARSNACMFYSMRIKERNEHKAHTHQIVHITCVYHTEKEKEKQKQQSRWWRRRQQQRHRQWQNKKKEWQK